MHTVYSRISTLSANLSTALLVLVGLVASTTFLFNAQPTGKIGVANVKVCVWYCVMRNPRESAEGLVLRRYTGTNVHYGQLNHEYSFVRLDVNAGACPLLILICFVSNKTLLAASIDLTPLFNWNTKQLFIYVVGEYASANGTQNEIVVWDRIVRRRKDAHIRLQNAKAKYMMRDLARSLGCVNLLHTLICPFHPIHLVVMLRYDALPEVSSLKCLFHPKSSAL